LKAVEFSHEQGFVGGGVAPRVEHDRLSEGVQLPAAII
jgi:hypothetical protein